MSLVDRAAPHEPLTITHTHAHPDGHGGTHSHPHSHAGNNWHTGATHQAAPGSPDTDMPGAQLNSADPDAKLVARAKRYLWAEGVDVEREFARVDREHEFAANRAREAVDRATNLALDLKAAEKRLLFEARGVRDGAAGFGRAGLVEAQARVDGLAAALDEACHHDHDMARRMRRQVA
jgi:hypothetical protein